MNQFADECREIRQQIEQTADAIQSWMKQLFQPFDQLQSKWQAVEEASALMNQTVSTIRPYFSTTDGAATKRRRAGAKKWQLQENFRLIQERADRLHHLLMYNEELNAQIRKLASKEDSGDSGLEAIISQIAKTQKIIIDVKFISLNAIIFAIHLGETGASFERVSDHLHETSVFIDKSFTEIINTLNDIVQWNEDFKAHMAGILEAQLRMETDVVPQLADKLAAVEKASDTIANYYKELNGLLEMMNNDYQLFLKKLNDRELYVQLLDKWLDGYELIREQYERLAELTEYGAPVEQQLDYITFVQKGLDAMTFVAPYAISALREYSDDIWEVAREGHERMLEMKPSLDRLSQQFSGQSAAANDAAQGINTFLEAIQTHFTQIGIIETCLEDCGPFNLQINEHFHNLENGLKVVSEEVSMLDIIRFLSHVELAKVDQVTLKSFGQDIDAVVVDVTNAIGSNTESLNDVKKSMERVLEEFKQVRLTSQRRYNDEMYHINTARERLEIIQGNLSGGFNGLSSQAAMTVDAYDAVIHELEPMRDAVEHSVDLVRSMESMKDRLSSIRQQMLNHLQTQRWDIKNAELSELSGRFQDLISEFQLIDVNRKSA